MITSNFSFLYTRRIRGRDMYGVILVLLVALCCMVLTQAWQLSNQNRVMLPQRYKWISSKKTDGLPKSLQTFQSLGKLKRLLSMSSVDLQPKVDFISSSSKNPSGHFEAHLEVMSGSANELESQQGMAHLLEHVAYMGSTKRQLISGTGSQTNAYTDFHHTVFFASCPSETPDQFWKKPMLPMALDALLDVMTPKIEEERLEKERAAVLSEASMVNKMEYRVECQILSTLHAENRISQRFPIGKEHLIKSWRKEDLELYHSLHYRPDNVVLFIVGDVDVDFAEDQIKKKFGSLEPKIDAQKVFKESKEFPEISMRNVYRHFPPVVHNWSCRKEEIKALIPAALLKPVAQSTSEENSNNISQTLSSNSKIFHHELLQSFSFHLFAKRPIERMTTSEAFKRELMRRIVLSTLQIRLNVQQRKEPLFTFADFNQLNWPREGCAVCSLDISTDTKNWKDAVRTAVREIRRLGLFGVTAGELERYKQAVLVEAAQQAAEADQKTNQEVLQELMEAEASGHVYMDPRDAYAMTESLLSNMSLTDVNEHCIALCEHLSHMNPAEGVQPAAIVACAPTMDRSGQTFEITEADLVDVLTEAMMEPLTPLEDTPVPKSLLSPALMQERLLQTKPHFVPLMGKALKDETGMQNTDSSNHHNGNNKKGLMSGIFNALTGNPANQASTNQPSQTLVGSNTGGVTQRRLNNGIRVNFKPLSGETQRVAVRMYVPGGRILEDKQLPGTVLIGARTMQEGGAFKGMSREQVEMFCIDHNVMVEITAGMDALIFDFQTVTTKPSQDIDNPLLTLDTNNNENSNKNSEEVTGVEGLLQVMHVILTDFLFEQDAFDRAIQSYHEQFDATVKNLESACQESITYSITGADPRFLMPNHFYLDDLSLPAVEAKMRKLLRPENVEVTIAGDLSLEDMENLVLKYLGSVPPSSSTPTPSAAVTASAEMTKKSGGDVASATPEARLFSSSTSSMEPLDKIITKPMGKSNRLAVYMPDSDERAMGYLAGPAPNKFGYGLSLPEGSQPSQQHPLHAYASLLILQEVVNRRLFTEVREERRLTYDASFKWVHHEGISNGWYLVAVTASPETVQPAIRACQEALQSLSGAFGVTGDSVQAAKRTLLTKHRADAKTNRFWTEWLSGTQCDHIAAKTVRSMMDFETVLQSVTVQDIRTLVDAMNFADDNMTVCIGITAPSLPPALQTPSQPVDEQHIGLRENTALN